MLNANSGHTSAHNHSGGSFAPPGESTSIPRPAPSLRASTNPFVTGWTKKAENGLLAAEKSALQASTLPSLFHASSGKPQSSAHGSHGSRSKSRLSGPGALLLALLVAILTYLILTTR